ncbi:MAG: hypothetical protein H6623_05100 [Bdellovibrionaceae bacterium]|nr:hypothetical protein [Pseudobdellovibrionaceae bacterium]
MIYEKNAILFAIFLNKIPERELSQEGIHKHVEYLKLLDQRQQLVLCGPFSDHPSGLVVILAENKEEAELVAQQDPFVSGGYRSYEVRTWLLANQNNNYLA